MRTQTSTCPPGKRGRKRSRILFLTGIAAVLIIGGVFATETIRALQVRAATGSVFADYVVQKHIGHAEVSDDTSGFQGDFCVLQLNQEMPLSSMQSTVLNLLYEYHDLDGGTSLSIVYKSPGSQKDVRQADALYDANTKTVILHLYDGSSKQTVTLHEDWGSDE